MYHTDGESFVLKGSTENPRFPATEALSLSHHGQDIVMKGSALAMVCCELEYISCNHTLTQAERSPCCARLWDVQHSPCYKAASHHPCWFCLSSSSWFAMVFEQTNLFWPCWCRLGLSCFFWPGRAEASPRSLTLVAAAVPQSSTLSLALLVKGSH